MSQPFSLDVIQVASPCHAAWEGMQGDARVRHCGECQKNVYNLSAMTRQDAEALLQQREGKMCVRFFRRSDGTLLTADCPVGLLAAARRRLAGWFAAAAAALLTMAAFGNVLARSPRTNVPVTGAVMGKMAVSPPVFMGEMEMGDVCITTPATPPPQPVAPPQIQQTP